VIVPTAHETVLSGKPFYTRAFGDLIQKLAFMQKLNKSSKKMILKQEDS